MKPLKLTILAALLVPLAALAASPKATLKVGYDATSTTVSNKPENKTVAMTLLAGPEGSVYFNEMSLYVDSLNSTPKGRETLEQIQMAAWVSYDENGVMLMDMTKGNAPKKDINLYVVKSLPDNSVKVYDQYRDLGVYTEPLAGEMAWELLPDSARTVMGYECVGAKTLYHGREWMAWFAPEIPVSDGPWKLQGLPGLILEAYPTDGSAFHFVATGLEKADRELPPIYSTDDYEKVDRRKALADYDYYKNHYKEIFEAENPNARVEYRDEDGNLVLPPKYIKSVHALETDY